MALSPFRGGFRDPLGKMKRMLDQAVGGVLRRRSYGQQQIAEWTPAVGVTTTIAIVGAGPGGLVLARVLEVHGIPSTIYELDTSVVARDQGGSLDLHEESGQRAMHESALYDAFLRLARPEDQALRFLDKRGTVLAETVDNDGSRPEIDRGALRALLVDSLAPGRIAWGRKVSATTGLGDGRHILRFANGDTTTVDLLVGADGAWSKVRPLLSAAQPEYTGISLLELHLPDADRAHPEAAYLIGHGTMFALADSKGLLGQRNSGGNIRIYAALRVPENWITSCGVDWTDASAARAALLHQFADWSDALKDLIRNADGPIIPRPIYVLPIGHRWPRMPGVTLLGDAAHLMSPFAGQGVNLAMLDATELALALVEHGEDTETALAQYEAALFPRSEEAATHSASNLENRFKPDAAPKLAAMIASMNADTRT